jgi:hypothetical protein
MSQYVVTLSCHLEKDLHIGKVSLFHLRVGVKWLIILLGVNGWSVISTKQDLMVTTIPKLDLVVDHHISLMWCNAIFIFLLS